MPPSAAWSQRAAATPPGGIKCRIHGGYRLQEILLVNNDFVVVDFEGDPTTPLDPAPNQAVAAA